MKKNICLYLFVGTSILFLGFWLYNNHVKASKTEKTLAAGMLDEKQLIELKTSSTLAIIMFHATAWCSTCTAMLEGSNPVYKHFMAKSDPALAALTYQSFQVDIDTSSLAQHYPKIMNIDEKKYKITGVPTFVFIKKGKEVHREVGSLSMDRLQELTKAYQKG